MTAPPQPSQKHPALLYVLFSTELWERFAYYLMVGLFTIYLVDKLNLPQNEASQLYGNFTALVYFIPLIGGFVADRLLGFRLTIIIGALLMAIGYFLMAYTAYQQETHVSYMLYAALGIAAFGNGLFKPNISSMVGNLYPQGDPRRDSAFSIFYVGINIGAFLGPIIGGELRMFQWWYAFFAAGVGMLLAMFIFLIFYRKLKMADIRSSVSAVLQVALPKQYQDPPESPKVERNRIISIFLLAIVVMFFWMSFHQNGTTLTFWAKDHTDLTLGGLFPKGINPEHFQSVNPFFIFVLTMPVVWVYKWMRKKGFEPSTPTKIGIGMIFVALSFALMVIASLAGGNTGKVHMGWLIACYFIMTLGELNLSPMGLSLVTKLSPARMVGAMMGVWFIATAIGNKLVGVTGGKWTIWSHSKLFLVLTLSSVAAAALLFIFRPFMKRAMPKEKS